MAKAIAVRSEFSGKSEQIITSSSDSKTLKDQRHIKSTEDLQREYFKITSAKIPSLVLLSQFLNTNRVKESETMNTEM